MALLCTISAIASEKGQYISNIFPWGPAHSPLKPWRQQDTQTYVQDVYSPLCERYFSVYYTSPRFFKGFPWFHVLNRAILPMSRNDSLCTKAHYYVWYLGQKKEEKETLYHMCVYIVTSVFSFPVNTEGTLEKTRPFPFGGNPPKINDSIFWQISGSAFIRTGRSYAGVWCNGKRMPHAKLVSFNHCPQHPKKCISIGTENKGILFLSVSH